MTRAIGLLLLVLNAAACGGASNVTSSPPVPEYFTATIDGVAFKADLVWTAVQSDQKAPVHILLYGLEQGGHTGEIDFDLSFNSAGDVIGTTSVHGGTGMTATVTPDGALPCTGLAGNGSQITITRNDSVRIAGTFQIVGFCTYHCCDYTSPDFQVTSGAFSLCTTPACLSGTWRPTS